MQLYLLIWVDDFIWFGSNEKHIEDRKKALGSVFKMTDEGQCSYYLGIHVRHEQDNVYVNQTNYAR